MTACSSVLSQSRTSVFLLQKATRLECEPFPAVCLGGDLFSAASGIAPKKIFLGIGLEKEAMMNDDEECILGFPGFHNF